MAGNRVFRGSCDHPRVISDRIVVRITSEKGNTFLDRMISLVEGAKRAAASIEAEAARERGVDGVCGTCVTKTDGICTRKGCGRRCCAACMDDEGLCPMCEEV
mgnify:CR=1 FL=1